MTNSKITDAAIDVAMNIWNFADITNMDEFTKIIAPRIQSALDTAAQEARIEAIEECALLMDGKREIYRQPEYAYPNGCLQSIILAKSHAESIRVLADKK